MRPVPDLTSFQTAKDKFSRLILKIFLRLRLPNLHRTLPLSGIKVHCFINLTFLFPSPISVIYLLSLTALYLLIFFLQLVHFEGQSLGFVLINQWEFWVPRSQPIAMNISSTSQIKARPNHLPSEGKIGFPQKWFSQLVLSTMFKNRSSYLGGGKIHMYNDRHDEHRKLFFCFNRKNVSCSCKLVKMAKKYT